MLGSWSKLQKKSKDRCDVLDRFYQQYRLCLPVAKYHILGGKHFSILGPESGKIGWLKKVQYLQQKYHSNGPSFEEGNPNEFFIILAILYKHGSNGMASSFSFWRLYIAGERDFNSSATVSAIYADQLISDFLHLANLIIQRKLHWPLIGQRPTWRVEASEPSAGHDVNRTRLHARKFSITGRIFTCTCTLFGSRWLRMCESSVAPWNQKHSITLSTMSSHCFPHDSSTSMHTSISSSSASPRSSSSSTGPPYKNHCGVDHTYWGVWLYCHHKPSHRFRDQLVRHSWRHRGYRHDFPRANFTLLSNYDFDKQKPATTEVDDEYLRNAIVSRLKLTTQIMKSLLRSAP